MNRPRMDLYDKLPVEVRRKINDSLIPISAEYIYNLLQRGWTVGQVIEEIKREEFNQHNGAAMFGVVCPQKTLSVKVTRKHRRMR